MENKELENKGSIENKCLTIGTGERGFSGLGGGGN